MLHNYVPLSAAGESYTAYAVRESQRLAKAVLETDKAGKGFHAGQAATHD